MSNELIIGFLAFALVTTLTPGPNTLMLMASGANFGFRRSSHHVLGVGLGFAAMVVLVGIGAIKVFDAHPASYEVLKIASVAYLLYLAYRISTASAEGADPRSSKKPLTFFEAALYQWINPKSWTMALTAVTVYTPSQSLGSIALIAAMFGAISLPSVSLWTVLGENLRRFLTSPRRLRAFNMTMGALLVVSLYPAI